MGLKLNIILIIIIAGIFIGSLTIKVDPDSAINETYNKELEFTNTLFTEVSTKEMQGRAYGTYGIRENGVLTLDNLVYYTDTIKLLVAKKGKYSEDILYLDGDVIMEEKDGYVYKTQHANYSQKTEILNITSPFSAKRDKNVIKGDTLRYDTRKKEAFGTNIDAVLYTSEK